MTMIGMKEMTGPTRATPMRSAPQPHSNTAAVTPNAASTDSR